MSDDTPSPLNNVITIDDERIKSHLDRVVRGTVDETLNALLDAEADRLCDNRGLAQSSDRARAPVCLSRWDRAQAQLGRRGAQRLATGCNRRERERLSGDSRHLRGGEGGQEWLERVPQASQ